MPSVLCATGSGGVDVREPCKLVVVRFYVKLEVAFHAAATTHKSITSIILRGDNA